jgi:hypothetical protein
MYFNGVKNFDNSRMPQSSQFAESISSKRKAGFVGYNVKCKHTAFGAVVLEDTSSMSILPKVLLDHLHA